MADTGTRGRIAQRMKLLIDMNLSARWVFALDKLGIAAVHWRDLGAATAPDSVIFLHAFDNDLVVLTNDLDFGAILAITKHRKPSVIQLRVEDTRPESAAGAVALAVKGCKAELAQGALLTIDEARLRIAILPLDFQ
jgi:predicted nuclease of predicted toxin-antitoxin system